MDKLKIQFMLMMILAIQCEASPHRPQFHCRQGIATSTIYFIPHIKDYCPGYPEDPTICRAFKRAVKMQGTGTLAGDQVLRYDRGGYQRERLPNGCTTAVAGGSNKCLIPYISVAADPRFYRMGDIIEMPSMKGKLVTMPDGSQMVHPGYFIVQDAGGAIKGPGRFDFFTGSERPLSSDNIFGPNGKFGSHLDQHTDMESKHQCLSRKTYTVIRRNKNRAQYQQSLAKIEEAFSASQNAMVASNKPANRGATQ